MKHDLHGIKGLKHIGVMLLILAIAFVSSGAVYQQAPDQNPIANTQASRAAISDYLAAQQNTDLSDEEKIKVVIDAYFTLRYEGQKAVREQDFSSLVEDNNLDWVKKEQDKREIELYIASLFDLGYQSYKFSLNYDSIEIEGDQAVVQLRESHQVVFNAIAPEVSGMANLKHIIMLHNKKDGWVISGNQYQDELSQALDSMAKEDIKKRVDENYQEDLERQKQNSNLSNEVIETPSISATSLMNYAYNRAEAVYYADTHIPTESCPMCGYNTAYYRTEYTYGDCTNFVSQALYAGGGVAPPDTRGMTTASNRNINTDWYYVFNSPVGTQNGSGSTPWIGVEAQKTFIATNTNKIGPYGYETADLCYVNKGDMVQIRVYHSYYDHEGLIVGKGAGCGTLSNTLVDAHMNDRYHYPLSYWSSYPMRFIVISGYKSDLVSSFVDVQPTHWAWQEIERLYSNHITGGCATNPLNYCPDRIVTRAEMAVFLLRGIHGYSYLPPPVGSSTGFDDVPITYWAAAWIKQLYAEGITGGCAINPLKYCPEDPSTHAQMAVFLLKSKYGRYYAPSPVGGGTGFWDVPTSHWAAAWISK